MGLEEYLGGSGIASVEWPERCPEAIPERHLAVRFLPRGETEREITFTPQGGFPPVSLLPVSAQSEETAP